MNEPLRPPPLAAAVAAHLEGLILEGVLAPGERLAPERELADTLGVSRPSLREGLDMLEAKGLLVRGKAGHTVAQFLAPLAGLLGSNPRIGEDYFEYRRLIEPQAAALAARRATAPDRDAIADCLREMEAAHAAADPALEAAADTRLHLLIHEATHNLVLLHVLRMFAELLRQGILYSRERFWQRQPVREAMLAQHRAIAAAVLAGDASQAEATMRDHIAFAAQVFSEWRGEEARLSAALRKRNREGLVAR